MKKILSYVFVLFAFVTLNGCLEQNPTTSLSEMELFSSEDGLESLMTGAYQGFKLDAMQGGHMFEYLQCGSLLVHWKGNRQGSEWQQALDLTMYSTDKYNGNCFASTYKAINRCNNIIDHLPTSPVDEKYKIEIEAEAKLLRAVLYYYAVRMWGDLPLIVKSPKTIEEANYPRVSYLTIYKQILDDLSFAEENMRDDAMQRQVNGNANRANKWAATAWKACVYLQIGCILSTTSDDLPFKDKPDFSKCGIHSHDEAMLLALQTAENVIQNGPYKLADKYTDLFKWTNPEDWQLKERIFVIATTNIRGGSTSYSQYTIPEYMEGTSHESAKAGNWGRVRPERWVFQKWAKEYGGKLGENRSDKLTNVYVSCEDPRFDATYIYNSYKENGNDTPVRIYPADGCVSGVKAGDGKGQKNCCPYFRKYVSPAYNANDGEADLYLLRFAEMYLTAAEAAASLNQTGKAYEYIEELHKRARRTRSGATMPKWTEGQFRTQKELINAIFWERIFELSGETHEWFDMRRRGASWIIENITVPFNDFLREAEQGVSLTSPTEGVSYWHTYYFHRTFPEDPLPILKGMLCAFPQNEILRNPAITTEDQNKYYIR